MVSWDPSRFSSSDLKKIYDTNFILIGEYEKRLDVMFKDDSTFSLPFATLTETIRRLLLYKYVFDVAKKELAKRAVIETRT